MRKNLRESLADPAARLEEWEGSMHPTRIDLPGSIRAEVAGLLNARLADGVDLMMQAKQAHWNVKGPSFHALHLLFDRVHGETEGFVDLLAERATQLGATAEGTVRTSAARSTLTEYPAALTSGKAHVDALASALAVFGKGARGAIETATELGDAGTADLFTEISRGTDVLLWLVEAHLQADS